MDGVAGTDEADGAGNALLEVDVWLKVDARAGECRGEVFLYGSLVGNEEFLLIRLSGGKGAACGIGFINRNSRRNYIGFTRLRGYRTPLPTGESLPALCHN